MPDQAITVANLSKRYRIGVKEERQDTAFGAIGAWLKSPVTNYKQLRKLSKFDDEGSISEDVIWALRGVSFDVRQGEVVGIVGRNGAGKTTLLKIIARITEPTSGRIVYRGRVSSLLEVGTGFHPELTGRENVYLNGTILGMSKGEIDRKFQEIVDFSGVEKFIDTPVKRFSSGMQVRLAFAVAAHLEPEILLVDEVLAVGDAAFQRKCLGKLDDVATEGRTVLFVSHNVGQMRRLCRRGIWLSYGACMYDGGIDDAIAAYQASLAEDLSKTISAPRRKETPNHGFKSWRIANSPSNEPYVIREEGPVHLEITIHLNSSVSNATHALTLRDWDNEMIGAWEQRGLDFAPGTHRILYKFKNLPVRPGIYYWHTGLWNPKRVDHIGFPQPLTVSTADHSAGGPGAGILNVGYQVEIDTVDSSNEEWIESKPPSA